MTPTELIDLLVEAQMLVEESAGVFGWKPTMKKTEAFARLVAAKEREACAILCDNRSSFYWNWQEGNLQKHEENRHYAKASEECADAIRARGEQA